MMYVDMPVGLREKLIREDESHVFDLSEAPLLKATLFKTSETSFVFTYAIHHIVCDGLSLEVLQSQLVDYYNAFKRGEELALEPLSSTYGLYSSEQQEEFNEKEQRSLEYWYDKLKDLTLLELPTDRPRPAVKTSNGASYTFEIDEVGHR